MSAFMGLSPNNNLKNGLIRAESVFMALYMTYIYIYIYVIMTRNTDYAQIMT